MERLTRLVDGEMEAATLEDNEVAELEKMANLLSFELNKVIKRQVELIMDEDDENRPEDDEGEHIYDPNTFADGH